jgi:two-component system, OmpR family, response regulator
MRVLIVEDDVELAAMLRRELREQGILADVAIRGEDALWMAGATPYDAITLDVGLPGIDGFETCRRLRSTDVRTPILMLSAHDALAHRVAGLDTGADDYVTKPFDFAELVARLRALARRAPACRDTVLRVGDLELDRATLRVRRGETDIPLGLKALQILEVLMRHAGEVVSRHRLLESAWEMGADHRSNVIEVHIRYLRERIDRPFGVDTIETVRGAGYRLRVC